MKNLSLIVSCEHAVNTIPEPYKELFIPHAALLMTHQGIDFGALEIARHFQDELSCVFIHASVSRLLIDCNRSLSGRCFSFITKNLSSEVQQKLITQYYLPYRNKVIAEIKQSLEQGKQVLHCSIHSFTPIWNDVLRNAEVAFLYDPRRSREKLLAEQWRLELKKPSPHYKIRMNYPYKGISDGFTTSLRQMFTEDDYLGIEIECNQAITQNKDALNQLKENLSLSLKKILY